MTSIALPRGANRVFRVPDLSFRALAVVRRNLDVYLNVWQSELIWPLVEPLVMLLALGVGLGDVIEFEQEIDYVEFVGPALVALFPMWTATAECTYGSYFRMDQQGTFSAILATPISVDEVTTGEIVWAMGRSVFGVFYVMVIVLVFGGISSPLALLIFPLAVLPGLMFAAIALAYSAIARSVSSLNYFFATYMTPQFWLSGAFFPLDELPDWVEVVAWFTPVYHVVELYRGLAAGDIKSSYLVDIGYILVVGVAAYALALALMRRRLVK
jgi:lipooligosaccharide transport system permease protein